MRQSLRTTSSWARQTGRETLEANKQAFVAAWVQRPAFRAAYDGLSNEAFVDALIAHTEGGFNGRPGRPGQWLEQRAR